MTQELGFVDCLERSVLSLGNPAQTRRCPGWVVPRPGLQCAGAVLAYRSVYEGLAASFWVVVPAR